jgi:hypothetical protein
VKPSPISVVQHVLLVLLPVLLVGCAHESRPGSRDGDVVLAWTVDTLYSVGRVEGGEDSFARVDDVRFDPEGRLLVLDGPNHVVHVFSPRGEAMAAVGTEGRGPGELEIPVSVAPFEGGVALLDVGRDRIVLYDRAHAPLESLPLPDGASVTRLLSHPSGALVLPATGTYFDEPDSVAIYRYRPSLRRDPEVLFRVPNPQRRPQVGEIRRNASGGYSMRRQVRASFFPDVRVAVAGATVAVVSGYRYRIGMRDGEGRTTRVLERPIHPAPVDEAMRAAERKRVHDRVSERQARGGAGAFGVRGMTPEEVDAMVENMAFPDTVPTILALEGTPEGDLWVLRSGAGGSAPGPVDLYDADDGYRGTLEGLRFPRAIGPGGLVAWVAEGPLGIDQVVVGRILTPE